MVYVDLGSALDDSTRDNLRNALMSPETAVELWREAVSLVAVNEEEFDRLSALYDQMYADLAHTLETSSKDKAQSLRDALSLFTTVNWSRLNRTSDALAILYNFSPFADTGSTVASKRLRNFGDYFDVLSTNLTGYRGIDPTVQKIIDPYVVSQTFVELPNRWASPDNMNVFAQHALQLATTRMETSNPYEYVYSRAMFVDSHVAAAAVKLTYPDLPWIAEFSDPLSLKVDGNARDGAKPSGVFMEQALHAVFAEYPELETNELTVFKAVELITMVLSDQLIFTNDNQLATMLAGIPSERLVEHVRQKAEVSPHPTLPPVYYTPRRVEYEIDEDTLNLAYFGEFYANRGLTDVTQAMAQLPPELRQRVVLHVFTSTVPGTQGANQVVADYVSQGVSGGSLDTRIVINKSLPYLEFLEVSAHFDYLIVTDTASSGHELNPYLPSKWSDYRGSPAKTWALVESNSVLATQPVDLKTPRGDTDAARATLEQMLSDKFGDLDNLPPVDQTLVQPVSETEPEPDVEDLEDDEATQGPEPNRWDTAAADICTALPTLIPPRLEPLYHPDGNRVLLVASRSGAQPGDIPPAQRRIAEECPVTPVSVLDPLTGDEPPYLVEDVPVDIGYSPRLALTNLAMDLAARARDISAAVIVADHTPFVALAALIAARRLGIGFVVSADQISGKSVDQNVVFLDPEEALRDAVIDHADLVLSENVDVHHNAARRGVPSHTVMHEAPWAASQVIADESTQPAVRYIGQGSGIYEGLTDVATVRMSSEDELEEDVLHATGPWTWVLDFTDGVHDRERVEKVLWRAGKAGYQRIAILGSDIRGLSKILRHLDVLVVTDSAPSWRTVGRGLPNLSSILQLPLAGHQAQVHYGDVWDSVRGHDTVMGLPGAAQRGRHADEVAAHILRSVSVAANPQQRVDEADARTDATAEDTVSATATGEAPDATRDGISLIIPTYQGAERIGTLLASVAKQSLSPELIELVIVSNGPVVGTEEVIRQWQREHPQIQVTFHHRDEPGVANARNLGLDVATKEYLTFVDDDDWLGENYLLSLYVRRRHDVIVVGQITDVAEDGEVTWDTSQNRNARQLRGRVQLLAALWHLLGVNAGKLIPSHMAQNVRYDSSLRSAEDQLYMLELLKFEPFLTGARPLSDAAYMRIRRHGSVSRRDISFEFNVLERLAVMQKMTELTSRFPSKHMKKATEGMTHWHGLVVTRYLENHPHEKSQVKQAIADANLSQHPDFKDL